MSDQTKNELLEELEQLKQAHITLKKAYDKDVAELKKAEARSRKSEEKYQQLFLDSPISLWEEDFSEVKKQIDTIKKDNIKDLRTWLLKRPDLVKELAGKVKIVDINHATLELYKARSKDDFFQGIPSIFSKESYDSFVEALIVIAEGRRKTSVKKTHVALDGSLLHIHLHWTVAPGFEDTYSRVLVSIVDNTEHILMEKSLSASEEKHRRLFETMSQGIVYHEADGNIFSANPAAERILGLSLDQMQGKTSMDPRWKMINENGEKVTGHDHPAMIALRTGKKFGPVTRGVFIPEQDKYIWLSITGTPLFKPGEDKPFQVYAVFDDVTLLKQKQDELKKQQQLIYTVLEKLPIGIAVNTIGPKENVELINDNFAKIYGVDKESLPSVDSFWEAVYEDKEFREKIRSKVLSDLESGDPDRMQWHDIPITKNGRIVKYISAQTIPLKDHNFVISTVMDVTKRKLAEQFTKDSEERFQRMLAIIPDMISIHDKDMNIIYSNWNGYAAVDEEKRKLLTKCYKTYRGRDTICIDCQAKEVIKTKKAFQTEVKLPDGSWIDLRVIPVLDNNDDVELFVEWVRDITVHKKAIEKLKNSDRIFTHVGDMLSIASMDGYFKTLNPAWEHILGWSKEELISKPWREFVHPEDKNLTDRIHHNIIGGKKVFQFENRYICKNGQFKWLSWNSFPYPEEKISINVARDITDRKKTEKTKQILLQIANEILHNFKLEDFIKAVEQQLSEIVDTTNFYIALYDSETGMLSAPFEKDEKDRIDSWMAKGSASGLVIDKKQSVLLQKQDVLRLIETAEIEQTGSICESWLGVPLFKGTDVSGVIVVQSYDNPEAFDSNTMELFEYVSNQISMALERTRIFEDLVQAKNKAEESDRLKSAFLANMSHEIRTPMNGIMGFAQLLKDPHLSDEQQQKYIEIIDKSGVRMLSIINDIVDISRIEAGVMEVDLSESNINEQLDYIYSFFKPQVDAKQIQLILSKQLSDGQETITTDREKLFAVLTNLVKNAIKYSKKGTIEYGCIRKGSFLEFFIKDTGIGIRKDRQQAVFDRFVQADIEDKEARQGAGLGLAISKAYVEMLGGEIWVESEEGTGSTFYFTIPYRNKNQEIDIQEIGDSVKDKAGQKKRFKILIVEDDEMSAMLLNQYVQSIGKDIFQAANGVEAVEISRQHPDIDLILMDLKMPGIDGVEAAKQIRTFNKDVVIIAQTAKALTSDKVYALEAGFNDFITKPINKSDLLECIEKNL